METFRGNRRRIRKSKTSTGTGNIFILVTSFGVHFLLHQTFYKRKYYTTIRYHKNTRILLME